MPIMPRPVRVSIIVPVCNNPGDLHDCLVALKATTYSNFEIIVVDDASVTDETRVVADRAGVKMLRQDMNAGPSSARNRGAREATGDILFFVDADVVVGPHAVSRVADTLARRVTELRIFDDAEGRTNLSLMDVGGAVLVVSQFTLYADTRRGRRPGFTGAAAPELAERLYLRFAATLGELGVEVATGRFGAVMAVELVNDGPFTIWLDTADR